MKQSIQFHPSYPQCNFKCEIFITKESLGFGHLICCRRLLHQSGEVQVRDKAHILKMNYYFCSPTGNSLGDCMLQGCRNKQALDQDAEVYILWWLILSFLYEDTFPSFSPPLLPKLVTSTTSFTPLDTSILRMLLQGTWGVREASSDRCL